MLQVQVLVLVKVGYGKNAGEWASKTGGQRKPRTMGGRKAKEEMGGGRGT